MKLVMKPYRAATSINDLIQGLRCLMSPKGTRVIEAINFFEEDLGKEPTQLELVIYLRDFDQDRVSQTVSILNKLNLINRIKKGKHVFYSINWVAIEKLQVTLKKF